MINFSASQTIPINTRKPPALGFVPTAKPYDPTGNLNRVIDKRGGRAEDAIYSIDVNKFLKVLANDQLSIITKTTLIGRPINTGVGLWDTLFNTSTHRRQTACVFLAKSDFSPIPISKNRILTVSHYLDFDRETSRPYFNEVEKNDVIGIGLNDTYKRVTYILLYRVDDFCTVKMSDQRDSQLSVLFPAINVSMEHILKVDHDHPNEAQQLQMGDAEYDSEKASPFMQWIVDTVNDIPNGYPWKPHFQSTDKNAFDYKRFMASLQDKLQDTDLVDYLYFEDVCRALHKDSKPERPPNKGGANTKGSRTNYSQFLPIIQTITFDKWIIGIMPDGHWYKFPIDDLRYQAVCEIHLTCSDLKGKPIEAMNTIMMVDGGDLGRGYSRFLSLNF